MSHNNIKTLPYEINNLCNLETITLSNNIINCLPKTFYQLNKIKSIYLQNNNLCDFDVFSFRRLDSAIHLDGNRLTINSCLKIKFYYYLFPHHLIWYDCQNTTLYDEFKCIITNKMLYGLAGIGIIFYAPKCINNINP